MQTHGRKKPPLKKQGFTRFIFSSKLLFLCNKYWISLQSQIITGTWPILKHFHLRIARVLMMIAKCC